MSVAKAQSQYLIDPKDQEDKVNLESTVGAFATRIARKLKERDAQQTESERAAEIRHNLLLEAMNTIRKALQETLRINLGQRFHLDLWVDDWDGWPRVQLVLIDKLAPKRVDYAMMVSANDRREVGSIEFALHSGQSLGKVEVQDRAGLTRLSLTLKKSVRQFLDTVAAYVLDPTRPEDLVETMSKPLEDADVDPVDSNLQKADVFTEGVDYSKNNVIEVSKQESAAHTIQEADIFVEG